MPLVQLSAFLPSLEGDKFKRAALYFFYGPEPRRAIDAATKIRDILQNHFGADNYYRYIKLGSAEDVSMRDIVSTLNTISMFGSGKVVWLGPLDSIDKNDAKILIEYMANPNPDSTLIVNLTVGRDDNRALADFEKSALYKTVVDKAVTVKFIAPKGAEAAKWVKDKLKEKGVAIRPDALERLVELADRDLEKLDGEIEKLSTFIGTGKEITLSDVDDTVSDARTDSIWDLCDATRNRDLGSAMSALGSLLAGNIAPQVILKTLTGEVMRIAAVRSLREKGMTSADQIAQEMGAPKFTIAKSLEAAGRWKGDSVKDGLEAIYRANMDIMGAGASPELALAIMLTRLCGAS